MNSYLNIALQEGKPVTRQIVSFIEQLIRSRQLAPGFKMPSTRALSRQIGVHRKTVTEAYERLQDLGLINTENRKGTFVTCLNKNNECLLQQKKPEPCFDFRVFNEPPDADEAAYFPLSLDQGYPDFQRGPFKEFNAAYKRAYRNLRRRGDVLHNPDDASIVKELSRLAFSQRGVSFDEEHFCFIRGCQMALYLIAQIVAEPGDCIVMEEPALDLFRRSLAMSQVKVLTVPQKKEGIDTVALQKLCETKRVKAVLVYPHSHWPTTQVMPVARRTALLRLAREYKFAIIEADLDGEFIYKANSARMISENIEGNVIYLSCFSAMLPQLSFLTYVIGPAGFIRSLNTLWNSVDKQRDLLLDRAVYELLREGILARYIRRCCAYYKSKIVRVADLLDRYLAAYIDYDLPDCGLAFWLRFRQPVNADLLKERLSKKGLSLTPIYNYVLDNVPRQAMRIGFAAPELRTLEQAFKIIAAEIKSLQKEKQLQGAGILHVL